MANTKLDAIADAVVSLSDRMDALQARRADAIDGPAKAKAKARLSELNQKKIETHKFWWDNFNKWKANHDKLIKAWPEARSMSTKAIASRTDVPAVKAWLPVHLEDKKAEEAMNKAHSAWSKAHREFDSRADGSYDKDLDAARDRRNAIKAKLKKAPSDTTLLKQLADEEKNIKQLTLLRRREY